jgi:hypothetical protein
MRRTVRLRARFDAMRLSGGLCLSRSADDILVACQRVSGERAFVVSAKNRRDDIALRFAPGSMLAPALQPPSRG